VLCDNLPFLAACDALVKVGHALLNVSAEHVFNLDLSLASADNLVADLGHETAHSLRVTVGAAQFKNHTHTVEDLRH
jgi:diphthamide synthase subunit DPH2